MKAALFLKTLPVKLPGGAKNPFAHCISASGPTSNTVTEKASYAPPELSITVVAGGYTVDGSGRHIDLSWVEVPGVQKYAYC